MARSVCLPALGLGLALVAGGCGPSHHPVSGVVKLDGNPVAGATVNLISENGTKSFSGFTDSSGAFTVGGEKEGAVAGTYKVTVYKSTPVPDADKMSPGSPEYLKQMQKEFKDGGGKVGPTTGPWMPPPPSKDKANAGPKSELPGVYASPSSTPLTATVPVPGGQLVLDLKSK